MTKEHHPTNEGIEITPEMIEAGVNAYAEIAGWEPSSVEEFHEALIAAFRAMLSKSRICHS